jgi:Big-like domain-containing protein
MKRASIFAASFLLTLACNGDKAPTTTPVAPVVPVVTSVGVSVSPVVQTIPPGQTAQLIATARYSDGSTKDVTSQATWTSSQGNVATVSAGAITGVSLGRTLIRVNFERWSASMTIVIEPNGTFILKGKVTEGGAVAVSGALVEVISGPAIQAQTNLDGLYELFGVGGTVILRVAKTGYFDERRAVTISADQSLDVEITPRSAPALVGGTYRVTFTASAACTSLPADVKTRTYTARIDQDAARLLFTFSGAQFVNDPRLGLRNTFPGKVFGDSLTFDMGSISYYYSYFYGGVVQEMLPSGQTLTIWGTATASATPPSISGTLVGGFTLKTGNSSTSCARSDNQVVFTRQ